VLTIDYDYNIYQTNYKGKGTYIQASKTKCLFYLKTKFYHWKKTPWTESNTLKTSKTNSKIHENKIEINDLKESELKSTWK
jgi:inner membrane protein